VRLQVGALGTYLFPEGWYVYTGSAFGPGGIRARVARHRRGGPTHWHVDYLARAAELVEVVEMPGGARGECDHARAVRLMPGAVVPARGFGSSDCRCPAHLVYFAARPW
jgi:Uri superfamily endonuclease